MSVNLYDNALMEKFRSWTKDTSISILAPNETRRLFEMVADESADEKVALPLIALSRRSGFTIQDTSKQPLSFDGFTLEANHTKAKQLNAIPISIPYQLDIYTRYQEEADQLIRNIVFNIINFPKLQVNIPYNSENYKHDANIYLSPEVDDNSDIPERLISGQFTRMSLQFEVDDAYLFDVRYRDVYSIDFEVTID